MRNLTCGMPWWSVFVWLAVLAPMTLAAPAARAQINPFRGYSGPVLSKADLEAGRAAARRLLDDPKPSVGMSEAWTGPSSGNRGTVTVEKIYRQNDHDCRAIRSSVVYKDDSKRSFLLKTCQIAGKWKLM